MAQYHLQTNGARPRRRKEYIYTSEEAQAAGNTICGTLLIALLSTLLSGTLSLAFAPRSDINFAGLSNNATCLRVTRRADYAIVHLDVGSPLQRLKLLLDLEAVVDPAGESLQVFSSRLHKSLSMACKDLEPPREYAQLCHDVALVAPEGSSSNQRLVHTSFVFQNDQAAYAESQPASLAGLDGAFRLTRGQTYWLTTTHLCFSPLQPTPTEYPMLLFEVQPLDGKMYTQQIDLLAFDANLALAQHPPRFEFYDALNPIFTSPRFLPPAKVQNCQVSDAIISHGACLEDCEVENAIIGLR